MKKATMKQTADPNRQAPNPRSLTQINVVRYGPKCRKSDHLKYLSHLLRAKKASSSFDRSSERSGTYALVLLYILEKKEGSAVGLAARGVEASVDDAHLN